MSATVKMPAKPTEPDHLAFAEASHQEAIKAAASTKQAIEFLIQVGGRECSKELADYLETVENYAAHLQNKINYLRN